MIFPLVTCTLVIGMRPAQEPLRSPVEYMALHRAADQALQLGEVEVARGAFLQCMELSEENPTIAYGLACVESRGGDTSLALGWLEKAVTWGYADPGVLAWDEDLANLRADERYVAALQSMSQQVSEVPPFQSVRIVFPEPERSFPRACAIDPSGSTVLVGYDDGSLALIDSFTARMKNRMEPFESAVWAVTFSPDGSSFAALAHDGTLGIWNVEGESPTALATAMRAPMTPKEILRKEWGEEAELDPYLLHVVKVKWSFGAFLQFDRTGERLLVAGTTLGGSLWTRAGECVHRWEEPLGGPFDVRLAWSPDGNKIAWATGTDVRFFDGHSGEQLADSINTPSPVYCLDFNPDGSLISTGHKDGLVRMWRTADRSLVWKKGVETEALPFPPLTPLYVSSIAHSPEGQHLAFTTGVDVYAVVLDFESESTVQVWMSDYGGGRMGEPSPLRWSPDGTRLWFAFASGGMALKTTQPAQGTTEDIVADGFVPSRGWGRQTTEELGVTILDNRTVAILDARGSYVRWIRAEIESGVLLQAPTGHFTTESDSVEGWTFHPGYRAEPEDLGPYIEKLFDPKRVRASQAGIRLVPGD